MYKFKVSDLVIAERNSFEKHIDEKHRKECYTKYEGYETPIIDIEYSIDNLNVIDKIFTDIANALKDKIRKEQLS